MGWLGSIAGGVLTVGKAVGGFAAANAGAIIGGATTLAGSAMAASASTKAGKMDFSMPKGVEDLKNVPSVEDASKLAAEKLKEKRRDINRSRTVFSSPLGQVEEADISVKTLLGK